MGIKRIDGFEFKTWVADHLPYHVHVSYNGKELGRFDVEHQRPMDKKLIITRKLRAALKKGGYLK